MTDLLLSNIYEVLGSDNGIENSIHRRTQSYTKNFKNFVTLRVNSWMNKPIGIYSWLNKPGAIYRGMKLNYYGHYLVWSCMFSFKKP